MLDVQLMKKEKIIKQIEPTTGLRAYFSLIGGLIWIILIAGWPGLAIPLFFVLTGGYFFCLVLVFIGYYAGTVILVISLANLAYKKYDYIITNKRIIAKSGMIGYRIASIPLNRISDVVISRNAIEMICGITSLHIQSLAGGAGIEGKLLAVPEPQETQLLILKLAKVRK